MSMERSTRWTAWTALATSAFALGLSVWSIGCEKDANADTKPAAVMKPIANASAPTAKSETEKGKAKSDPASTDETAKGKVKSDEPSAGSKAARGKESKGDPAQPKEAASDARLKVKRLVVTHDVEQREPVAVDTLSTNQQVVAFVELANDGSDAGEVEITFEQEGKPAVGHIKLEVPAEKPRWRTWGKTRMVKTPGPWEAVVRSADGTELARTKFVVGEGEESKLSSSSPN